MSTQEPVAKGSYREALKSTTLVGGSRVASLVIGIFRSKILAVVLGPSGIALFGLYESATGLIRTLAGLGIRSAGVRQIAEASGEQGGHQLTVTAIVLRRVTVVLGLLGAVAMVLLRNQLSLMTFGNLDHAWAFGVLAALVFLQSVQGGFQALIQGCRRIRDLAAQQIIGALAGVLITVPLILWIGERGVPWAMVGTGLAATSVAWWFARRIELEKLSVSLEATWREVRGLVSLSVIFLASGFMVAAVAYGTKTFVARFLGLGAMGLYQASGRLSNLYVGMVLQAMGADFYPRLTGVASDNAQVNRMVNEQAEISILLAAPGVIATLVFAPLILAMFYSREFIPATEILRWQILGVFARVIIWPMGFISLAKGEKWYFLGLQVFANAAHLGLLILGVFWFDLTGVGIAFFMLYLLHAAPVYFVAHRISGFTWSKANKSHWLRLVPAIGLTFLLSLFLPVALTIVIGTLVTIVAGFYSLRQLHQLAGEPGGSQMVNAFMNRLPASLRRFVESKGSQ